MHLSIIDLKKIQPDYIYVTEGNVYQVLDYMRKNGLLRFIQQQMKRTDCTYIGSSAGAMIAGTDIYLAEDFDENIVGLTDLRALGLFDGSIIPHYSRQDLIRYINNSKQEDIRHYSELYSVDDNEALVEKDSEAKRVSFKRVKVKE